MWEYIYKDISEKISEQLLEMMGKELYLRDFFLNLEQKCYFVIDYKIKNGK